jgi:hypothetical protein
MYYIEFETASGNKKEKAFKLKRDAEAYFFEMVEWSDNIMFFDDKCRVYNEYPSAQEKAWRRGLG